MAKIVVTTYGSLGDLHPYLALSIGLQERGHEVVLATCEHYRSKVERDGIEFFPVRPDIEADNRAFIDEVMDFKKGPENMVRKYLFPNIHRTYEDLMRVTKDADLLVSSAISYAAPMVAETSGIPWVSTMITPLGYFSAHDPPVLTQYPQMHHLRRLGVGTYRTVFNVGKLFTRKWVQPVYEFREQLGLERGAHPLFGGQHSPLLGLGFFSDLLGKPQPDWPPNTKVCGFLFYERDKEKMSLPPDLVDFLQAGPPPVVFTLGSAAVWNPGRFYRESLKAVQALNCRAVFLTGDDPDAVLDHSSANVFACPYASYALLFPQSSIHVHQGGVGTVAQSLKAGKPMVMVPHSHEQLDNAVRFAKHGNACWVDRKKYSAERVAAKLKKIMEESSYAMKAEEIGRQIRRIDSMELACQAIEGVLQPILKPI
ncbi:MAG: glycosyltransferase [Bacteroidota bacterium]